MLLLLLLLLLLLSILLLLMVTTIESRNVAEVVDDETQFLLNALRDEDVDAY